jgi:hypothetical protein
MAADYGLQGLYTKTRVILVTIKADKNMSDCLLQSLEVRESDVERNGYFGRERQLHFAKKYLTGVIEDAPARARSLRANHMRN